MFRRILSVGCALLGILFNVGLASGVDCAVGTTTTISSYLNNYNRTQYSAVAYAWTGGHWNGASWGHRTNPNNIISVTTSGSWAISGPFSTNYDMPHPNLFDSSNAEARAQCGGTNCGTPSLVTNACVTAKKDSAGAGAYARAGTIASPKTTGDKRGTATISIPNRMTLSGSVGDVTGVWALIISVEDGAKSNPMGKQLFDVHPWMIDQLGLKEAHNVHPGQNRPTMFAVSFKLDPHGKIDLVGPIFGTAWDEASKDEVKQKFLNLKKKFKIEKCKKKDDGTCHIGSYEVNDDQIEVPIEWTKSGDNKFFFEVGTSGNEEGLVLQQ